MAEEEGHFPTQVNNQRCTDTPSTIQNSFYGVPARACYSSKSHKTQCLDVRAPMCSEHGAFLKQPRKCHLTVPLFVFECWIRNRIVPCTCGNNGVNTYYVTCCTFLYAKGTLRFFGKVVLELRFGSQKPCFIQNKQQAINYLMIIDIRSLRGTSFKDIEGLSGSRLLSCFLA